MIRFNCSECDRPFKVADEHAGKSIRCPGCKGVIKVPAEEPEEESVPPPKKSRAVLAAEDAPPKRKPRLEQAEEEEETPRPRKARLEQEEEEDEAPRRRKRDEEDEEDEDDRPRKKKKSRKKQDEEMDSKLFIILSLGLSVLFVVLSLVGWFHRGGAIVMLVVGAVPIAIGTWWIRHIAQKESDFEYFACLYVPFYDTWFTLTRWSQTWGACLTCWIGRVFLVTGVILLIMHFLHDRVGGGGGWVPPPTTPAEIDAECARLLKARDATEARAWLAVPGRRIQGVTVGQLNLQPAVEGLYQQGAVRVTFADMMNDEDGDDPMHLVVELPAEKEKRQAVVNYVNTQLLEPDDDRQSDRGQKYLLVLTN